MESGASEKICVALASLLLCLGAAEMIAYLVLPTHYYVWPPNLVRTTDDEGQILHGVWGPSRFSINAHGMRGDAYDLDYRYRILAVGGSTTAGLVLDDSEAWPRAVQDRVNERLYARAVFVGNVGRPGHQLQQHHLHIEKLLPQHPELDAVMMLAGVNDMVVDLNRLRGLRSFERARPDRKHTPPSESKRPTANQLFGAFSVVPVDLDGPWYKRSAFANWLGSRRWRGDEAQGSMADPRGTLLIRQREFRRSASRFRDGLPKLEGALAGYRRKLHRIADLAAERGVRLILLTQPSIWRANLPDEVNDRLWLGGPPLNQPQTAAEFFTVRALAEAMAAYNASTLRVCRDRRLDCIDTARRLPREAENFIDDVHFTEAGSRRVAKVVADYLLATEPLARRGTGKILPIRSAPP
jgi:lysophospholipase L1-like esterase